MDLLTVSARGLEMRWKSCRVIFLRHPQDLNMRSGDIAGEIGHFQVVCGVHVMRCVLPHLPETVALLTHNPSK